MAATGLALFDFDGTITAKDSLPDFIQYAVGRVAYWIGLLKLSPMLAAYTFGMIPNHVTKERLIANFFTGWDAEQFQQTADQYSLQQLDRIIKPEAVPTGVITAVGYLGEQKEAQRSFAEAHKMIDTNYTGLVSLLHIIADDFEQRRSGFIVGISSVAGDRGRASNYVYGSAKAAFTAYLSGLRNRLYESGVHVLTVKPGFVATKMTAGMDLPEKLTAQPEEVAEDVYQAQQKGKDVLYTKWMWKWVMLVIKSIPEWKFKGMEI